uniref:Syncytin-Ory1 n=1 Tax=Oryctolagus cuniculus TaxID=9986 RepID=U3KNQ8_RABIT
MALSLALLMMAIYTIHWAPPVFAGLDNPQGIQKYLQQHHPCTCSGGIIVSFPRTRGRGRAQKPHFTQDCGDKTAYLTVPGSRWFCVPKPKLDSYRTGDQCPSECNKTIHYSVHSSCYTQYQTCNKGNQRLLFAVISGDYEGTFGGELSSSRFSSPSCPTKGQVACWYPIAPVGVSDGGGPQDTLTKLKTQKVLETVFESLYPSLQYHPLAKVHSRGNKDLDVNTIDILTNTHKLLNLSAPNLARDCWLCLRQGPPLPLAIFLPLNNTLEFNSFLGHPPMQPFPVLPVPTENITCLYKPPNNNPFDIDVGLAPFCTNNVTVNYPLYAPNSTVFVCRDNLAYTILPTNWTGNCMHAILFPDIEIINGDTPVPIPSLDYIAGRQKRAIQFIPLLATLGISSAMVTGSTGLGIAVHKYRELSQQLINEVQTLSTTIQDLQDQIDSLAEVVLQNRRGLDLLTAERGSICLALQEKCCFYANKSGIVRDKIKTLQEDLERRRRAMAENPFWTGWNGLLPYLLPLLGPIVGLLVVLSIGPCLLNRLMTFIRQQVDNLAARPIQIHYQSLAMEDPMENVISLSGR